MESLLPDKKQLSFLAEMTELYHANLPDAKDYLMARGITAEAAKTHRLGMVSGELPPEHERYRGRLAIPYLTYTGNTLAFKWRCIRHADCKQADCVKYLAEDGMPPILYNATDLLRDEKVLFVTEGELDAVVLSGVLGLPCVAYPGVKNWRPYFNRAIGPDWERIYVVADGDEPGRAAARDIAKHVRGRMLRLPDGEDASSLLVKVGVDGLRKHLGVEE